MPKRAGRRGMPNAIFTDEEIIEIRRLADSGVKAIEIAKERRANPGLIRKIIRRVTYKWVE